METAESPFELAEPAYDMSPIFGGHERRIQMLAYNYWATLTGGASLPDIARFNIAKLGANAARGVILDLRNAGPPRITYVGRSLCSEGGIDPAIRDVGAISGDSLLARIAGSCGQMVANRAPVTFGVHYENCRGNETLARGIVMPFTLGADEGGQIAFALGLVDWKEVASFDLAAELAAGGMAIIPIAGGTDYSMRFPSPHRRQPWPQPWPRGR